MGSTWAQPLLCGYYGEHNLGDDALLEALLLQLPAGVQPWVTAADQALVEQRFQLRSCNRHSLLAVLAALGRCDALVFGGGSLLQDSRRRVRGNRRLSITSRPPCSSSTLSRFQLKEEGSRRVR